MVGGADEFFFGSPENDSNATNSWLYIKQDDREKKDWEMPCLERWRLVNVYLRLS